MVRQYNTGSFEQEYPDEINIRVDRLEQKIEELIKTVNESKKEFLDVEEVLRDYKVSSSHLYRLAAEKKVESKKVGGHLVFERQSLDENLIRKRKY